MMKIWLGSISCVSTMKKKSFLPGNWSFANAKPAIELNTDAQRMRQNIRSSVFRYSLSNGSVLKTSV